LTASGGEQHDQVLVRVLIGLGVVRVAAIDAHRDAGELAHEVVFEAGADDLAAVVEVFRADEADDGIDEERGRSAAPDRSYGLPS
jgi:hypothetical protein